MPSPDVASLALLLSLCATAAAALLEVHAVQRADCTLRCTAELRPGVRYGTVRWYKVGEPPASNLNALLSKDLPNGTVRWYSRVQREVELVAESHNIFLPNVTCGDSGVYTCHMVAPVGEQNRESQVVLALRDCPMESPSENPLTDTYLVVFATVVLMLALVIFLISYSSLKNIIRDRNKTPKKETLLDAALKPLGEEDLQSIYTLGPKVSKTHSMEFVCV